MLMIMSNLNILIAENISSEVLQGFATGEVSVQAITLFAIVIGAIFVNNVVLSQFLGICPFLGVSSKVDTSLGMGMAVTFVMALATIVTWCIQQYILVPFGIEYMQTITFILVIAALVQMVEIVLKKVSPALYQALGIFLPLITTNCAVLGIAIITVQKDFDLLTGVIYATSIALGFALALILFAGIRERLEVEDTPKAMRGVPIALITAGLLAMAFMGFANVVPLP
jgi:electron transport complex protein RnfA